MRLQGYEKTIESGQKWLGRVPAHWQVLPHRAIFEEVKEKNHPDEEMLSVTITKGIIKQKSLLDNTSKKDSSNLDKSKYKLVCPNDIAYNKMRAWQGAIGVSDFKGIISPAYIVMRLKDKKALPKYYHYLLRTPAFAKEAERWSYGITSDMWSLRPEHFKLIYSIIPPLDEQEKIVKYLDFICKKIDLVITAKKKLIALLNEQKQAIIHRAVTRGLDPNVRLKDSGIPWIGKVPEHWEVVPGKLCFKEKCIKNKGMVENTVLSLSYGKIIIKAEEKLRGLVPESFETYQIVNPGEIIIRSTDLQNDHKSLRVGLVKNTGIITSAYICLKIKDFLLPEYAYLLLHDYDLLKVFYKLGSGTRQNLGFEDLKWMQLLKPEKNEQKAIVDWVKSSTFKFDEEILNMHKEIRLLTEFKTKIISDVVTGKVDVQNVTDDFNVVTEGLTEAIGVDENEEEINA